MLTFDMFNDLSTEELAEESISIAPTIITNKSQREKIRYVNVD